MVSPRNETEGAELDAGSATASSSSESAGRGRKGWWRFMNGSLNSRERAALGSGPAISTKRVVLVGAAKDARRLARRLDESDLSDLRIVGFVDAGHGRSSSMRPRGRHLALHAGTEPVPVLGSVANIERLVDRARATHVVVAVPERPRRESSPAMPQITNSDVAVHWVSVESGQLDMKSIAAESPHSRISSPAFKGRRKTRQFRLLARNDPAWARLAKRSLDCAVALAALTLLAPLLAIVAALIVLTSGRPIFYTQKRLGRGGKPFQIIKFRSMRSDAERETGPIWASDHDNRCTPVGDWLRHTNIDELPQLINVLRGEMSLVGPRPERPSFVEQFRREVPDYDLRHAVASGMTGWAQVHGWRGRTSLRKRLQYDLDYIERWSIWLDLRILFMTVQHVLWGKTSWNDAKRPSRKPV
jgi:exopolysaccharide biosynthesis polyprenyl glycosylphosphotransferase